MVATVVLIDLMVFTSSLLKYICQNNSRAAEQILVGYPLLVFYLDLEADFQVIVEARFLSESQRLTYRFPKSHGLILSKMLISLLTEDSMAFIAKDRRFGDSQISTDTRVLVTSAIRPIGGIPVSILIIG